MKGKGVTIVDHYLDDFIMLGKPKSTECKDNLMLMLGTCEETGAPVEAEKAESPTTKLIFLGNEIDRSASKMRLYCQPTNWLSSESQSPNGGALTQMK